VYAKEEKGYWASHRHFNHTFWKRRYRHLAQDIAQKPKNSSFFSK
jgi:hypothetical protein